MENILKGMLGNLDVKKMQENASKQVQEIMKGIEGQNKPVRVSFPKAKFSCLLSEVIRYEGNPCILFTSQGDRVDMSPCTWEEVDDIINKASK